MYSKNIYKDCTNEKLEAISEFCESYKDFISYGKTERLCVEQAVKAAEQNGFINLDSIIKLFLNLVQKFMQSIKIRMLSYLESVPSH